MTLRRKRPLARVEGRQRDARIFVIAVEDTYIQRDYFLRFRSPRIQLLVLPTPQQDGASSPRAVLDRLIAEKRRHEWDDSDEFWISVDADRWTERMMAEVLREARHLKLHVAVSNPNFEYWLILHLPEGAESFPPGMEPAEFLRQRCGGYSKKRCPPGLVRADSVAAAIRLAKLDAVPPVGDGWPRTRGTQLHELAARLLDLRACITPEGNP